jgi:hypothetical protein
MMTSRLLHRLLNDEDGGEEGGVGDDEFFTNHDDDQQQSVLAETRSTIFVTDAPSSAPIPPPERFRILLFSALIILFVLAGWFLWNRVQKRNEQRRLDYRSAQADRVLGDMQMVPNADLDNELL